MNLVFATQNRSKLMEITHLLQNSYNLGVGLSYASDEAEKNSFSSQDIENQKIIGLADISCFEELPETHDTLEENALEKADYVLRTYKMACFADDSGLEVEALGGRPGVYSARYAGESKNADANMDKVLAELQHISNRNARFRTVIALVKDGESFLFEGIVDGTILHEKRGSSGFGYDPIFQPKGYSLSFAEMSMEEKGKISHRAIAVQKLIQFLKGVR